MTNKFYAIKIGNNVKDVIVESWEECKRYTLHYPSIYKSFKTKKEAKKYLNSITEERIPIILQLKKLHRLNRLRQKFQSKYDFLIPRYIIDEIINGKDYDNLCALINLAIVNNRLTENQGNILKSEKLKIKER